MNAAAEAAPSFGLNEDPIVIELQEEGAVVLGKEAALFCPTATMCNQIAIHIACSPGDGVIAESQSHVFLGESGSLAALSGALAVPVAGERGEMDLALLHGVIQERAVQRSRSALVVIENTHANLGGLVLPLEYCREVYAIATSRAVPVHLDGARLFNAAAALGVPASVLAAPCNSVTISLNKGLGAPMGALLAGSRSFIAEAIHVRQLFGGGWRPAGILAAAALIALRTMAGRLTDDHRHARDLANGLASMPGIAVDPARVETNIVFATLQNSGDAARFVDRLHAAGILVLPASARMPGTVRFVTHADIDDEATAYSLDVVGRVARRG